jgi:hypothetical protein
MAVQPHISNEEILAGNPAQLREALGFINNNDLPYDGWTYIGLAIKGALGKEGREDFLAFSAQHSKSDPRESEQKWDSFWKSKKLSTVGAGTIFYLAKQAGWSRAANSIVLVPGQLHVVVSAAIEALAEHSAELNLFQRGGVLVRPTLMEGYGFKGPDGERPVTHSLRLKSLNAVNIRVALSVAAKFSKAVPT